MGKDRIGQITLNISQIILMIIVLFSTLRSTIFVQMLGLGDRVFLVLIPILACGFTVKFFLAQKEEKIHFFKHNIWVIAYLAVRIVLLVTNGFDHYTVGSLIYEVTFLLLICQWTVGTYKQMRKVFAVFIGLNFVVNVLTLLSLVFQNELLAFGMDLAMYHELGHLYLTEYPYACLYLNPNTAGIMTAMALLVFFVEISHLKKEQWKLWKLVAAGGYIIFSVFMGWQYGCRSAILGLLVTVIIYIVVRLFGWDKTRMLQFCMITIICCNVILISVIALERNGDSELSNVIDALSTGRYQIWQDAYHTACYTESWILGQGSNEQELENRNEYLKEQWVENGGNEPGYIHTTLGIHNGYLGILVNAGIICFVLFVIAMWRKIEQMEFCRDSNWYLIVVFVLVVNNFESLLIMNRFYTCFLMMIVLTMGKEAILCTDGGRK